MANNSSKQLTRRQQAALAKARPDQRDAMRANFVKQDKSRPAQAQQAAPKANRGNGTKANSNALMSFAQGSAAVPRKAFGSVRSFNLKCWDSFNPSHLPLSRAVGPYSVVRTTTRFSANRHAVMIGTFRHEAVSTIPSASSDWTNICALYDVDAGLPINGTTNTTREVYDMAGIGVGASVVPAAISVQIVNPEALTATQGVVYAGVMSTQAAFGGSTDSWATTWSRFIQYQAPRMMMAGKLALRGVQINSYPLNMTSLSDFAKVTSVTAGNFTWSGTTLDPVGFAPIMVYNPQGIDLEYLVTTEWRVRFDLTNPASSSHTHHPVAPESVWDDMMRAATAMGHGVRDIADSVAESGEFASGAVRGMA